ncbi:hypothetical protein SAMN05920897_1403 [Alkalispirochaeta americana]|uniref:Uncharacterized protein n=1 Tax=Alkalispirochaeta americana TaxID=159291 RepID=A0A1N6Y5P1_9SPIO|nr:hypothetical protein [Alkalispirochaeta americana]SIR09864.1 hypothetical protein SAMN05920897_1403 [Alkalispirochaeta americana]
MKKGKRKGWFGRAMDNSLPFAILEFAEYGRNEELIAQGYYQQEKMDDIRYLMDVDGPKKESMVWVPLKIATVTFAFFLILPLINATATYSLNFLLPTLIIFCLGLSVSLFCYFIREKALPKHYVFDRLNQTVTLPTGLLHKPKTYRFTDLFPAVGSVWSQFGPMGVHLALSVRKWGYGHIVGIEKKPWESWSWLVWYMDKNRPLPPGTALDPYREKDRHRRKQEGNPEPLFPMEYKAVEGLKQYNYERKQQGLEPIEMLLGDDKHTYQYQVYNNRL